MSRDGFDDAPDVGKDGLSANERDHKREIDRLYRWIRNARRRH